MAGVVKKELMDKEEQASYYKDYQKLVISQKSFDKLVNWLKS